MKLQFTSRIFFNTLIFSVLLVLASCKKEYKDYPYSDMISFSLKDASGATFKAAITSKDITVYWPPFQKTPDSISPSIIVAEHATISPASGTKVPFKEGVKFTVTAQDGSKTVYTLKPTINQPIPYITSFEDTHDFNGLTVFHPDATIFISGDYFLTDSLATKVYLQLDGGKELPVEVVAVIKTNIVTVGLAELIQPGTRFKVKVVSGTRTILSGPCIFGEVLPLIPSINSIYGRTFKPGDTFTISGTNLKTMSAVTISKDGGLSPQTLVVQSKNEKTVTIKIPENITPDTYSVFNYTYAEDQYHAAKTNTLYGQIIIK